MALQHEGNVHGVFMCASVWKTRLLVITAMKETVISLKVGLLLGLN